MTELSIASGLMLVGGRVAYNHRRQSTKPFATEKKIKIKNYNKKVFFLSPRFGFYSWLSRVYIDGTFSPIKNNFGKMQPATTTAATENVKNRKAGRCSFITTQAKQ